MPEIRTIKAQIGTNQEGTSAHNKRVIIEALRLNGALSRADLARATRLTKQTISNLVETLELQGLVTSEEVVRQGRGQPSTPYRLVPDGAFAIGVQIDRHLTRAVAVDLVGTALVKAQAPLPRGGPEHGVPVILGLISQVRADLAQLRPEAEDRLTGLGVAMPGPFGLHPADQDPWMMAAWQTFPLLDTLAQETGLDVAMQNDAAACATAERMLGKAHGLDDAVCLYLGYGIGAGLILGGELYRGGHGNAGELGMVLIGGKDLRSPLEHRASLASLYSQVGLDPADPDVNLHTLALLDAGDPALDHWITEAAQDLKWAVHLIETLLDPQTVIISGGAPEALAKRLVAEIEPLLPSNAQRQDRSLPRLTLGMFDPWAVALGAAVEPISRAFDPRFAAILKE